MVRDFRDLGVWQRSFATSMEIFRLGRSFPMSETYSLVDQIRRSSRLVSDNIAEAWEKRRYEAAFIAKLTDACAYGYVGQDDPDRTLDAYGKICARYTP